jgi:hypothetical protein
MDFYDTATGAPPPRRYRLTGIKQALARHLRVHELRIVDVSNGRFSDTWQRGRA